MHSIKCTQSTPRAMSDLKTVMASIEVLSPFRNCMPNMMGWESWYNIGKAGLK